VPAASLHRHVARLVDAAVLTVVAERRVRAAVERTRVLRLSAAQLSPAEVAAMSPRGSTIAQWRGSAIAPNIYAQDGRPELTVFDIRLVFDKGVPGQPVLWLS
jgi:hypothetical protein